MSDITSTDDENYEPPSIKKPGTILFEILSVDPNPGFHGDRYEIDVHDYDSDNSVFWITEGVGIEYWIEQHVDLELPGFYVLEGIAGSWIKGDGYTTDDDEAWTFDLCRRASASEMESNLLDSSLAAFVCVECGTNTSHINEYYMVSDSVWAASGMTGDGGMLCIGCLEARIGRQLVAADFPNYPVNSIFTRSARLDARLVA